MEAKGSTVKIGFQKIQINGKWVYYNKDIPKNEGRYEETEDTKLRRRTI